ncbi:MAG: DUF3990 domain-containing protein [Erysipelotrichaceae bacterium]|nr:DUF3990 domain-containing protein [Erysipelotrichaceae bacterium]
MILFHGSDHIVEMPLYGYGKKTNDYGRGFYMTETKDMAKEWACSRNRDGFCNCYDLDPDGLKILDLNSSQFTILNWLAVLARYRTYWQRGSIAEETKNYLQKYFFVDPEEYDIVIGYRADDSYFSFAQDFVSGTISLRKLTEAMYLGKLGEQVVLKSEKAFSQIRFLGAEPAVAQMYYEKKAARDRDARRAYRQLRTSIDDKSELYILDILREEIKNDDPRLR